MRRNKAESSRPQGIYRGQESDMLQVYSQGICVIGPLSFLRITVVGQLATPASVNFAGALMIYAAVTIGTDGTFVPTTGQVLGL